MGKYDFSLDLESRNALALLLERVRPNSRVLEFGPANGRLTRYMQEQLHCAVDIVEIDAETGREAARYAQHACLGTEYGDIERYLWLDQLDHVRYDVIIFADVLEHLRDPYQVLQHCKPLLQPDGVILISIPNVAHNAVLISLLNEHFDYTNIGLLDTTHVHLFTYESFRKMALEAGYIVAAEDAVQVNVGAMEIPVNYSMISPSIARALKAREKGLVYQYVFQLSIDPVHEQAEKMQLEPDKSYLCECFVKNAGDDQFISSDAMQQHFSLESGVEQHFSFDLPEIEPLECVRIDPLDVNGIIKVKRIAVWDAQGAELNYHTMTNGFEYEVDSYVFSHGDPQIFLTDFSALPVRVELTYTAICYENEDIVEFMPLLEQKKQQLEQTKQELEQTIVALQGKLNAMEATRGYRLLQKIRRIRDFCMRFMGSVSHK